MLERDPFGKEGESNVYDTPDRDKYSVEGDRSQQGGSVFGVVNNDPNADANEKTFQKKKTKAWVIGGLVVSLIIFILAGVFGYRWYQANLFKHDRVVVSLEGPESVTGQNTERFSFRVENRNALAIENSVLTLRFPENFVPEERSGLKRSGTTSARLDLGKVAKNESREIDVYGYFSGTSESSAYIRATLRYGVGNSSGSFEREAQKVVTMAMSPVRVDVTAPLELASGEIAEIAVQYENRSNATLFSLRLRMEYPDGFIFDSADIRPSEGDTIWYLDPLESGKTATLKLRGKLAGNRDELKTLGATIGVARGDETFVAYGSDSKKVRMVGSPFAIRLAVAGVGAKSVDLGNELRVEIEYTNTGEVGLGNAIVQVKLGGKIFDEQNLSIEGGSYNAITRTISWFASDVPALAFVGPGESGRVKFTAYVRSTLPMNTTEDTNLKGEIEAVIDSADVPDRIGSRRVVAKALTEMKLRTLPSIVSDTREASTDTDSTKARVFVGREAEFVTYVRLRNTHNAVTNGRLVITIPSGVSFGGLLDVSGNEDVSYNDRSQQLVWEVGTLDAGTGILNADRVIAFRTRTVPQEYQLNQTLTLLNPMEFRGVDSFTEEPVSATWNTVSVSSVLKEE